MIDPILARTAPLFADAVRRYLGGASPAAFERAMQQALAQAHTAAYLRGVAEYRMVIYALALILIMIFRPQGLLGVHELWDRGLWRRAKKSAKAAKATGGGA